MKWVKLDFGAECRKLENYRLQSKRYYDVECPFCGQHSAIYYRNFAAGARCHNRDCRAMLRSQLHEATRDMLPESETKLVGGLRTRLSYRPQTLGETLGTEGGAE